MWIEPRAIGRQQTDYLAALGRAIALAQSFEHNCKFVFGILDLGDAFWNKKIDAKVVKAYAKKLQKRPLGGALMGRETDPDLGAQASLLEAARIARNYLAHRAAEPALYIPPLTGKHKLRDLLSKPIDRKAIASERREMVISQLQKMLPRFEKAVKDLAEGDSVVSKWSYIIQEKDVRFPVSAESYVAEAIEWVLEPMR